MSKNSTWYLSRFYSLLMVMVLAFAGGISAYAAEDDDEPKAPSPTMTPAYDSELTELSTITLDFGTTVEYNVAYVGDAPSVGINGSPKDNVISVSYSGNIATVTVSPAVNSTANPLTVKIPEGYFNFPELGVTSNEVYCRYYISGSSYAAVKSVTPANGSTITSLSEVEIYFEVGDVFEGNAVRSTLKYNDEASVSISDYVVRGGFFGEYYGLIDFVNELDGNEPHGAYTAEGTYVITIPAGRYNVRINGTLTPSEKIELTYYIGEGGGGGTVTPVGNVPASIDPASGSELESLEKVTLTWGDGKWNWISGSGATLEYNGNTVNIEDDWLTRDFDWYTTILTFPTAYTEPGDYIINFPAGMFKVGQMGNNPESDAFSINYTIKGGGVTISTIEPASVTPADQSTVDVFPNVTVAWDSKYTVSMAADAGAVTLTQPNNSTMNVKPLVKFNGNEMSMTFPGTPLSNPGTYTLEFPQGFAEISEGGDKVGVNPVILLTYTVEAAPEPETIEPGTITPANNSAVDALTEVSLTNWPGATSLAPSDEAVAKTLTGSLVHNGQTTELYFDQQIKLAIRPSLSMKVQLGDLASEPGKYTITIPEGFVNFVVDDENVPNAELVLNYTVNEPETDPEVIQEGVAFTLVGSTSLNYHGVFTPSKTGTLTISYDPAATVLSVREVLFGADQTTMVPFTLNDEGTEYYYEVTAGQEYWYLMGKYNPEGYTLYKAGTYTVTFTVGESQGGGGDDNPGGGDEQPEPQPLDSYSLNTNNGTYTEITGGTVVLNASIYDAMIDEGIAFEDMTIKSMVFGGNGSVCSGTIPMQPTSLPGIPFGFEFPFAGETFTHFLVTGNGAVILGGETIGNLALGGAIMDGNMGKFIFGNVDNVIGCVPAFTPTCLSNTEISYLTDADGLTVQYKNFGFAKNASTSAGAPVNMQLRLTKDGAVSMVYSGWDTIGASGDSFSEPQGPVRVALKGSESTMLTLQGGDDESIVDATLVYNATSPNEVRIYATLPDGYTLTFSPSQEECEAPQVNGKLTLTTTSTTLAADYTLNQGSADAYLFMLGDSFMMWQPEDGVKYTVGETVTSWMGTPLTVISAGTEKSVFIEDLEPGTLYYVGVWAYNTVGLGAPVYEQGYGYPPVNAAEYTMAAGPVSLKAVDCTLNSITLSAEGNSNGDGIIVIMTQELEREDNVSDDPVYGELDPNTLYEVGDKLEGGGEVIYIGKASDSIVVEGLENSTPYYFAAQTYEYTDIGGGYGYLDMSSDAVYAAGSTVVLPPYEMDFSLERRFVAPAGWEADWTTDVIDGVAVWTKVSGGGIGGGDVEFDYYLRFALGGVSSTGAEAWFITTPVYVDKAGYVATMEFSGEIYGDNPRDPAGPLAFNDGDYLTLSVSNDGGKTFTTAMEYNKDNFSNGYETHPITADLSEYVNDNVQLKLAWRTSVPSSSGTGGSQLKVYSYTVKEGSSYVAGVDAEDGRYVVYTLTGLKVLDTEDASEVRALERGFYIINGKKVFITK